MNKEEFERKTRKSEEALHAYDGMIHALFAPYRDNVDDMIVLAILTSWLSNGVKGEEDAFHHILYDIMGGHPSKYIYDYGGDAISMKRGCIIGHLTWTHLSNLLSLLASYVPLSTIPLHEDKEGNDDGREMGGDLGQGHCLFFHERAAAVIGDTNTGFPTLAARGTFYRYNYLHYLLSYKLDVWPMARPSYALLPCNDKVFENAYKVGLTSRKIRDATVHSCMMLTTMGEEMYGETDYYKLFEKLAHM